MSDVLVGVDVGTTRVKALAVSLDGTVLGEAHAPTPWRYEGACADIDSTVLANVAMSVADRSLDGPGVPDSVRVRGLGVTGMAEAGALLDSSGQPCAPTLAWYDPRGRGDLIRAQVTDEEFWRTCGVRLNSKPSLAKILYLYDAFPESRERASRHLGVADWVVHAMGGNQVTERSLVSRSGLYDVLSDRAWDVATDLVGDLMAPDTIWAGESAGYAGDAAPPRLRGAALTVAGLDHESASVAMGGMRVGVLTDSLGTAEALLQVFAPVDRDTMARLAERDVGVGWGVVPGYLCTVGALLTGLSLERMAALLGLTDRDDRRRVSLEALHVDRATVPFHISEVSHEGLTLSGVTEGLSPALAWRAAVEDLTTRSAELIAFMESVIGPRTEAMVTGGWSHDPTVAQAKARHLGHFTTGGVSEPAAMGAAFFGGIAAGVLQRPGPHDRPVWT